MENLKVCLKCNQQVAADAKFCPHCGFSEFREVYSSDIARQNAEGVQPQSPAPEPEPEPVQGGASQSPYGQTMNSQTVNSQTPYAQNDNLQSSYAQNSNSELPYSKTPTSQTPDPQPTYSQPTNPQAPYSQTPYSQPTNPQAPYSQPTNPQAPYSQTPYSQPTNPQAPYSQTPFGYQGQSSYFASTDPADQYPMKWFKFLIYFALFAGALVNFVSGINYITGGVYFMQSAGSVSAEVIYSVFEGLKALDVIFGVCMIALAGFSIYTRFRLAKYKTDGPTCLYILYGANAGLSLLYDIVVLAITQVNQIATTGVSLVVTGAMIALNVTYFTKRKSLFVN